nr:hypothetical protein CFP56_34702 [Quercus suber]
MVIVGCAQARLAEVARIYTRCGAVENEWSMVGTKKCLHCGREDDSLYSICKECNRDERNGHHGSNVSITSRQHVRDPILSTFQLTYSKSTANGSVRIRLCTSPPKPSLDATHHSRQQSQWPSIPRKMHNHAPVLSVILGQHNAMLCVLLIAKLQAIVLLKIREVLDTSIDSWPKKADSGRAAGHPVHTSLWCKF